MDEQFDDGKAQADDASISKKAWQTPTLILVSIDEAKGGPVNAGDYYAGS